MITMYQLLTLKPQKDGRTTLSSSYLIGCSLDAFRNVLLFRHVHRVEEFAEVTVDDVPHGLVVGAEREVISSNQTGQFRAHMHLKVLEKINVLYTRF